MTVPISIDELRDFLRQRQVYFEERPLEYGTQVRCRTGEIFNVYTSGKVVRQGKLDSPLGREVAAWSEGARTEPVDSTAAPIPSDEPTERVRDVAPNRRVFIVYGHDRASRDGLELMLRRWGLEPIVLQNLPASGDTVIEKLEQYLGEHGNVGFACVLLTPDDIGYPAGQDEQPHYRSRQNVILELGMMLARVGRRRVAILHKQSVELPSDIGGLLYTPFNERVEEVQTDLHRELVAAGYRPKDY